jgi:hypothetical protein
LKKLIYYPSFEAEDINWLKFALLYIDVLKPIIPRSGDAQSRSGCTWAASVPL